MNTSMISREDQQLPAWRYFTEAMRGKQYGAEETLDAWLWFRMGWSAKEESARLAMMQAHDTPLLV